MKDSIDTEKVLSGQVENFLSALKILNTIDFLKFPKETNQERFERISKMFNALSPQDKVLCRYDYKIFLERIGRKTPSNISQEIKDIVGSLVQKNIFETLKDFQTIREYLQSSDGQENWTEGKLNMFLQHITGLGRNISPEETKIIFTMLFHTPNFKLCSWNDENLALFARIMKYLKSDYRIHVRELFLSLPMIKKIQEMNRIGQSWNIILQGGKDTITGSRKPFSNLGGGKWDNVIVRTPV